MSEENKKTATERLEDLENTLSQVIQSLQPLDLMTRDLMGLKEALKLLNNKVDAIVKSVNAGGPITDEGLSKIMTENNAAELAARVAQLVVQGLLVATDTVGKDSFVVINEADESGTVVNPRIQFLLSALQQEDIRSKLEGSKVGAAIAVNDKGGKINVLEVYNTATPQAPEATAPAETTTGDTSADATNTAAAAPTSDASATTSNAASA